MKDLSLAERLEFSRQKTNGTSHTNALNTRNSRLKQYEGRRSRPRLAAVCCARQLTVQQAIHLSIEINLRHPSDISYEARMVDNTMPGPGSKFGNTT